KSHAAAYALLSYHTAYLKVHHPAAFMAANMSLAMDDTDKIKILVEDAIDVCGLKILPPDINLSGYRFVPVGEPGKKATQIRYGLGAVKGSGQHAIEAIMAARAAGGPFKDLFDFVKRVDKKQINRRTIEALIRAGAMDCFGTDRGIMIASVNFAMECAEQAEASANQVSLFGGDDSDLEMPPDYIKAPPWSEKQRLTEEKLTLGFYLSGHLFNAYADEVRKFVKIRLANLEPAREPRLLAGIISAMRTQMTQRGKILIVTLDDGTATVDVTVYNELYEPNKQLFKEDEFLAVQGKVSEDRFSGGLRVSADKVMDIAMARVQFGRQFALSLHTPVDAAQIKNVLAPYCAENGLPLTMRYMQDGVGSCEIRLAGEWRVAPADGLKQALFEKLGVRGAAVEY
ncbi:MAG TPA: OB-fold nucleic acid binding domain-containing protein, partial [Burkholderiaceae bacterium]|nr:OB-fold nucleic acid binding domain-containing protein [Burkholderiaceae bacterium]